MSLPRFILDRLDRSAQGWFGQIIVYGVRFFTAELDWKENRSNISCLPPEPGAAPVTYGVNWTISPRYGRPMYLMSPTAPRAGCRIHKGNYAGTVSLGYRSHVNGCILLGEKLGWINGQKAVLLSAPAIRRFETMMAGKPFLLEVRAHA